MRTTKVAAWTLALSLAAFAAGAVDEKEAGTGGGDAGTLEEARDAVEAAPAETPAKTARPVSAHPPKVPRPIYKPPKPGKPARTVGGGSRGTSDRIPRLFTVTPEHVGVTVSERPSLFWYIDRIPEGMQIEFALLDQESVEPLVETRLATPTRAGIQRIRLEDHDVTLSPGMEYEWSVTLIVDPQKRSKDIVATGWIDRIEPSSQLASRLEAEGSAATAAVYADEGVWYDSFAALSDQIERNPGDGDLLRLRADVLRQVGLVEAAQATDG